MPRRSLPKQRGQDETFDIQVYLPSHDQWKSIEVTKKTKASSIIQYLRLETDDLQNKQLALFFFDQAKDPFLEIDADKIYDNQTVEYLEYHMAAYGQLIKLLVQDKIQIEVPSIVKQTANEAPSKPAKKTRVVQSFHIGN